MSVSAPGRVYFRHGLTHSLALVPDLKKLFDKCFPHFRMMFQHVPRAAPHLHQSFFLSAYMCVFIGKRSLVVTFFPTLSSYSSYLQPILLYAGSLRLCHYVCFSFRTFSLFCEERLAFYFEVCQRSAEAESGPCFVSEKQKAD